MLPLALVFCLATITGNKVMAYDRQFYEQQARNPAVQKLLNTIRYAEGTSGPKGYTTLFGGGQFSDTSRHPDRVISAGGYNSAAAGAYQFMPGTWQNVANALQLKSFGPKEQDIAGAYLAHQRLRPIGGFARLEKEGLSPAVAAALAPEWASFPTQSGASYYGQPVKSLQKLQEVYGQTPVVAQTQAPQPTQQQALATPQPGRTFVIYTNDEEPSSKSFLRDFLPKVSPVQSGIDPIALLVQAMNSGVKYG